MTKVKICGITNLEDALLSAKFGADALGFNFYEKSPRYISPENAREIIEQLPNEILKVGVFVNENLEKIIEIASIAKLDALQLHGEETPEFARELKAKTNLEIIKAFRVSPEFKPEDVLQYETDAILLDAYSPKEQGGTGKTFDWEIAKKVQEIFPKMYLAGGLSTENIEEAILKVKPFAVDACSLLEYEKGFKNAEKLKSFIQVVKQIQTDNKFKEFVNAIKEYFQFLETDYGFTLKKATTNYNSGAVRYESKDVFVEAWYYAPQCDYDVNFGLLADKAQNYGIGDLMILSYKPDFPEKYSFEEIEHIEVAKRNHSRAAKFLRKYGSDCLNGSPAIYKQLKENREKRNEEYYRQEKNMRLRKRAEIAWKQRNYSIVIKSFQAMKESLSPVENKKLDYSEKMLDKND